MTGSRPRQEIYYTLVYSRREEHPIYDSRALEIRVREGMVSITLGLWGFCVGRCNILDKD
jgi:hypothetical protein